jgi:hypothetical protein
VYVRNYPIHLPLKEAFLEYQQHAKNEGSGKKTMAEAEERRILVLVLAKGPRSLLGA